MAEKESNLDCTGLSRNVWLVKVPKYLSETWGKADDSGIVGSLKISKTPTTQVKFELSEHLSKAGSIGGVALPREHNLLMSDVSQSLAVFSETSTDASDQHISQGESQFAFEGKVAKRADCRPVENPSYMLLKKLAIKRAAEPARKIQQITKLRHETNFKPIGDHRENVEREKRRKEDKKRIRAEKEEVMEKLFSAFEKHQYYTLKDLVHITQQPVIYLKSILKDVCIYNKKNPHKNTYELKPEYRHYKTEAEEG